MGQPDCNFLPPPWQDWHAEGLFKGDFKWDSKGDSQGASKGDSKVDSKEESKGKSKGNSKGVGLLASRNAGLVGSGL